MLSPQALRHFFDTEFPQAEFEIEALGSEAITLRKKLDHRHLRPGGTVSGPTLMALADAALYVAVLNRIGLVALAVTTNLNINFLRKPVADRDLLATARLIKVGRSLAVGEVSLFSEGQAEPVAHVVGTYALPPSS